MHQRCCFGLLSLLIVDIAQLMIPELYRLVINGVNLGKVVVDGQTLTFTPGRYCFRISVCP